MPFFVCVYLCVCLNSHLKLGTRLLLTKSDHMYSHVASNYKNCSHQKSLIVYSSAHTEMPFQPTMEVSKAAPPQNIVFS